VRDAQGHDQGQQELAQRRRLRVGTSEAIIDGDVLIALDAISEIDLQEIFLEIRALEEYQTTEAVALLTTSGKAELERWGAGVDMVEEQSMSAQLVYVPPR
jgi:hypothetical protein